jgi:hypothetical protein
MSAATGRPTDGVDSFGDTTTMRPTWTAAVSGALADPLRSP